MNVAARALLSRMLKEKQSRGLQTVTLQIKASEQQLSDVFIWVNLSLTLYLAGSHFYAKQLAAQSYADDLTLQELHRYIQFISWAELHPVKRLRHLESEAQGHALFITQK